MNEKELVLYEKIKICCMLKEQYEKILLNGYRYGYNNIGQFSYINKESAKQIYIAYLYVVIETLDKSKITLKNMDQFTKLRNTEYCINNKKIKLNKILYDYRNKTFHYQDKTYYNNENLYNIDLVGANNEVDKMIEILKENLKSNYMNEIQKSINNINSEFYRKKYPIFLKNFIERLKGKK